MFKKERLRRGKKRHFLVLPLTRLIKELVIFSVIISKVNKPFFDKFFELGYYYIMLWVILQTRER